MADYVLGGLALFLMLLLILQERQHTVERALAENRHYAEREALLNRLMARDLTEYVQADVASRYQPQGPQRQEEEEDNFEVGV